MALFQLEAMNSSKPDLNKSPDKRANIVLRLLGPGLVTGAADDDPSGIATYSQAGAQFGYGLLWTVFLTLPFMIAIQLVSAQIGRVTGKGIIANVKDFAPRSLVVSLISILVIAFLGRISPEKRADRAIRIARAAGIPLKIAAKVDKVDEDYFRNDILPLIDGPGVEFIGEINEREKTKFLGEAAALVFPIDWPEPFGLVMIEAMACGTPVLAFRRGSVSEVIDDGVTGGVVENEEEAIAALPALLSYDRRAVRQRFEERFSARRMAKDYVRTYRDLLAIPTAKAKAHAARPRRIDLNGGNGLTAVSIDEPHLALFEAGR
jgi:glycosyltransferase involved in cell wall biosynthesis